MLEYHMDSNKMLMALCLATVLASPAIVADAATRSAPPAGLPNFGTVDPGIYRGAAPTAAGFTKLKSMGVQTVIDLRISPKQVKAESRRVTSLGMRFVNLPMGKEPPTPFEEKTFLAIVSAAKDHPVYVHCQFGADRTGTMIGLYRRIDDGWTYEKTYAEMRRYGFKPWLTQLSQFVKNAAPK